MNTTVTETRSALNLATSSEEVCLKCKTYSRPSMRYRITLDNNNGYEAVIFRDFMEQAGGKDQPITQRKAFAIAQVYTTLNDELRGQSAFTVKRIEEVPED